MNFIGNNKSLDFLNRSLEKENINHAYLFSGPEQVGKFTLAKMFGRSLVLGLKQVEVVEDIDPTASLDLLILEPEVEEKKGVVKRKAIPTEKIREVQNELSLYPYHGAKKVLVINDAHLLTIGAQNALLKTLEEPASTSMIILVTHEEGRLLSTIMSRCQKLNFSLVSDEQLRSGLGADKEAIFFSLGRPGRLKNLLAYSSQKTFQQDAERELEILLGGTVNEKLKLAEELSKNIVTAMEKMTLWMWALKARAEDSPSGKTVATYGAIEKISQSLDVLKTTNANARIVLENLFIGL